MIANTKGQKLYKHLFAVGYLSTAIAKILTNNNIHPNLLLAAFNAGCLHDIGKVLPDFQTWVVKSPENIHTDDGQHIVSPKYSYDKNAKHHEVSLLIFHMMRDETDKSINSNNIQLIEHVIYWHHAKTYRTVPFKNLQDIINKIKPEQLPKIINDAYDIINKINELSGTYKTIKFNNIQNDIRLKLELPKYKDYNTNDNLNDYQKDIGDNAKNSFIRSVVVTADRLISELSVEELDYYIESGTLHKLAEEHLSQNSVLPNAIEKCLQKFEINYPNSERNIQQSNAAKQLSQVNEIAVLQGAAGCGKTKIALEWAYHGDAKKIIWVCPRVSVCQNIYHDLTSSEYLSNVNIEINTGEFKYNKINGIEMPNDKPLSGDIIITTIDQISNTILTHRHVVALLEAMNSHVIFDEYHEYITMDAFNVLFAEFLHCKRLLGENTNTLLVSATPNPIFLTELLDIHKDDCIKVKTFNDKIYNIRFRDYNPEDEDNLFYEPVDNKTFVITNMVSTAQKSFLKNADSENAITWHGKLAPSDTLKCFNTVTDCFGKGGNNSYDILRSSHIIQASINISCDNMISEVSHAENTLQRMGRLNRFGENDNSTLTIGIPTTFEKSNIGMGRFLYSMHIYDSSRAWVEYLQSKQLENITLGDIYAYYDDFYTIKAYGNAVRKDILKSLKSSVGAIGRNVLDPVAVPVSKKSEGQYLKKNSLRNDCRYIIASLCKVVNNKVSNYAYGYVDGLTLEYNRILGYGDSNKNLLAYMHQKHHKMMGGRQSRKDSILGDAARNSNNPIYVSYTVTDLAKSNEKNNPYAIYYVVHDKQAVGLMDDKNLNF